MTTEDPLVCLQEPAT